MSHEFLLIYLENTNVCINKDSFLTDFIILKTAAQNYFIIIKVL